MKTRLSLLALTLTALGPAAAFAKDADNIKIPANNPCEDDVQKYCADVVPGEGRLAKCMKSHASELSSDCKSFGKKLVKKHPGIAKQAGVKNKE